MIKSEGARLNGWTYVDISGRDLGSYVAEAQRVVAQSVDLPAGYSLGWSGQYEYMLRAKERLSVVGPLTLAIIMLLLYVNFRRFSEVAIIMGTLPMALVGGVWLMHALGYNMSVAVAVGFIALAGIVVRNSLLLIDFIIEYRRAGHSLEEAVFQAGVTRLRPILLTAIAIVLGTMVMIFDPVFGGLAVSLIFGTVASTILTLFVIPLVYLGYCRRVSPEKPLRG